MNGTAELRSTGQPRRLSLHAGALNMEVDEEAYTLWGPRFFCCWHLVMMAERNRVRRSSGNS
jgi:hypothetical protein